MIHNHVYVCYIRMSWGLSKFMSNVSIMKKITIMQIEHKQTNGCIAHLQDQSMAFLCI